MELSSVTPDATALRALSHPVRLRLLGLLRMDGPSTASALAERLGLNSGATSYHLRQLAQHGFVVDDPERGNGRERWWKAAHQATRTRTVPDTPPEQVEAVDAFAQAVAIVQTQELQQALEERTRLPVAWRAAASLSDWRLVVTPERAEQLVRTLNRTIEGWEEDDEQTPGAEQFVVVLDTYLRPGREQR